MTLDEYIDRRSAREPEFASALAILRELVEGDKALTTSVDDDPCLCGFLDCVYCEGFEVEYPDEPRQFVHDDTCPIRRGRDLLAAVTQPT